MGFCPTSRVVMSLFSNFANFESLYTIHEPILYCKESIFFGDSQSKIAQMNQFMALESQN